MANGPSPWHKSHREDFTIIIRHVLTAAIALLAAVPAAAVTTCDAVWRDPVRGRDLPLRIRLPDGRGKVPVVLWSPGLGGDTSGGADWATAWVERGLAVVHLEHPGSNALVYKEAAAAVAAAPDAEAGRKAREARIRQAANGAQLAARVRDAGFVLGRLGAMGQEGACNLARIDTARAGIAGHSMGAWVVQAVAGQRFANGFSMEDSRFRAGLALSGVALTAGSLGAAFGRIGIPYFAITSTADGLPLSLDPQKRAGAVAERIAPWRAMPPGEKYLLLFEGGDHMAFAGNRVRPGTPDARIHAAVRAASAAFWGATLLGDAKDAAFLKRQGLGGLLAAGDRLETK